MTDHKMWHTPKRLVVVSGIVMDIMMYIETLPPRGGDVMARVGKITPGGAFNVIAAASRLCLPAAYAGRVGSGMFGQWIRRELAGMGVETLGTMAAEPRGDTGFDVALVEPSGERTFVTALGAEAEMTDEHVQSIGLKPGDAVYISGYDLLSRDSGRALRGWVTHLPWSHLVIFDPGPLVGQISGPILDAILERVDIFSANRRESEILTGCETACEGASQVKHLLRPGAWSIVRDGARGAWLCGDAAGARHIPGRKTHAVDTTGAGDVHAAAVVARLAAGRTMIQAVREANVAASLAVEREGPAEGPWLDELESLLEQALPMARVRKCGESKDS